MKLEESVVFCTSTTLIQLLPMPDGSWVLQFEIVGTGGVQLVCVVIEVNKNPELPEILERMAREIRMGLF